MSCSKKCRITAEMIVQERWQLEAKQYHSQTIGLQQLAAVVKADSVDNILQTDGADDNLLPTYQTAWPPSDSLSTASTNVPMEQLQSSATGVTTNTLLTANTVFPMQLTSLAVNVSSTVDVSPTLLPIASRVDQEDTNIQSGTFFVSPAPLTVETP